MNNLLYFLKKYLGIIMLLKAACAVSSISNFTHQGFYMESGRPYTGLKNMEFKLFDTSSSANELYASGSVQVQVVNGVYAHVFGSGNPAGFVDWGSGVSQLSAGSCQESEMDLTTVP